jgi:hypothetical protein
MSAATADAVTKEDGDIKDVQRRLDQLFDVARKRFGDKARRTAHGISLEIDATDPRWVGVFGSQWDAIKGGAGPHTFNINAEAYWKEECDAVRRFEACRESESMCTAKDVQGSVLQMRQQAGAWRLALEERPEQAALMERGVSFLRSTIDAERSQLEAATGSSDEDTLVALATAYQTRMMGFVAEMQRAAAETKGSGKTKL